MIIETIGTPKIRLRLAQRINEALKPHGFRAKIDPMRLSPATGAWRTNIMLDVYRWEGFIKLDRCDGAGFMNCSVDSWDTMTNCARYGVEIEFERPYQILASAKGPLTPQHPASRRAYSAGE